MKPMEIRFFGENDDVLRLSEVYEKSWKYAYDGIIPREYLDSIPSGKWASVNGRADMRSLILTDGEKIVGTSCFGKSRFSDKTGWGEIVSIYLLPEYMGKGHGRQLLKAAVAELHAMGYRDVFLWCLEENTRARSFYEKAGFICENVFLDDNIGGKQLREVRYILPDGSLPDKKEGI